MYDVVYRTEFNSLFSWIVTRRIHKQQELEKIVFHDIFIYFDYTGMIINIVILEYWHSFPGQSYYKKVTVWLLTLYWLKCGGFDTRTFSCSL